ncbi:DUF2474 family protein [uncultured Enterovirga sp.]
MTGTSWSPRFPPWLVRLAWFTGLWAAGVVTVGIVAYGLRLAIR